MSKQEADLIKGLRALVSSEAVLIPGKVESVDLEAMTCEVKDIDDFLWHNVKLQALSPVSAGAILIPEKGSYVVMGREDHADSFFILVYSNIEEVRIHISGKYVIANDVECLFDIIDTLLDTLSQAFITTPSGPGSFAPKTVNAFADIKKRFGNLLKKEE